MCYHELGPGYGPYYTWGVPCLLGGTQYMAWETISAKLTRRTGAPALSIQKNGRVSWNAGMQRVLGNPEWVRMVYDRATDRLALSKAERAAHHFAVRKAKTQESWGFSAYGPLRTILGIDPSESYRRYAEDFGDGIWGIDIKELREREDGHQQGALL